MMPPTTANLHVAGIGASAGGLEAMLPMFAGMPTTGRVAYVVAQHMARNGHDALLVRLISRESNLPVVLAQAKGRLQADTVYVIPSGKDGTVEGNLLILQEPLPDSISTPSVNVLFRSIAASQQDRGIGIVLSGTGYDGVAGCQALKARGAWTLAQDPGEAKFDGLPTAAIEAGNIDEVLSVAEIGVRLARRFPGATLATNRKSGVSSTTPTSSVNAVPSSPPGELGELLRLVHGATGIDFSSYKEETLLRRLDKRMANLGFGTMAAYLNHVRKHPDELKTLQHHFLVSVSSFFRDAESFAVLRKALVALVDGKPAGETIRVWVPGCASGEEAYTLAILLRELTDRHPIRIIATDLNPEALAFAIKGSYRITAFKEMDTALRQRTTRAHGQDVEVLPEIRALVHFEKRNVLAGSPAPDLDLVSCRNLLIYMKSALQDQLVSTFHRSLHPHGLLFIGQSESLSFFGNSLFEPVDHYHRLFRRRH